MHSQRLSCSDGPAKQRSKETKKPNKTKQKKGGEEEDGAAL